MERRPTVLELVNSLRRIVNWTTFAQNLPQIKEYHIDKIKAENKDNIDEQKRALYNKWLAVYPEAKFSDVINALEKSEQNNLAKRIKEEIRGEGAKGEASGDVAGITKKRLAGIREKWLAEGTVEVTVKRINMQGPPGAGKTCTLNLLLNRPVPPNESTPIACRAVKATRVSRTDGENTIWEEIDNRKLLEMLADDLCNTDQHQPDDSHDDISEAVAATPTNVATPNKTLERIANRLDNPDVIPKELSKEWMYIVDSGGQPAYQELLPLFTRAPSLNIIVLDLTKGAKDEIQFHYRKEGDEKYLIPSNEKYTNIGYVEKVIKSGAILPSSILATNEEPKSEEGKSEEPPYYFVIGTHYDECCSDDGSPNEKFEEVNGALLDLPKELTSNVAPVKRKSKKEIVHPINATEKDETKRKENSKELCKCILNCGGISHKFKMPTRWFAFELSLLDKAGDNGFLTMTEVYKVGDSLKMNKEDTNDALTYLHNVTTIIYYPGANLDKVFVDPQPILDALSSLLALTYVDLSKQDNLTKQAVSPGDVDCLGKKGMFKKELIKQLKLNDNFPTDDFIKLLCHLYVIAKIDDNNYFIPCALPPYTGSSNADPLIIVWRDTKKMITIPVPRGIFPTTIVRLMHQNDQLTIPPTEKVGYLKHQDAISFCLHRGTTQLGIIHIINKYKHIEVYTKPATRRPLARQLVREAIEKSCRAIGVDTNSCKCALICPNCPQTAESCYCIVNDEEEVTCEECFESITKKEYYQTWFADRTEVSQQSSKTREDMASGTAITSQNKKKKLEKKPEVKDLVRQLTTLVHWERFAENLPKIEQHHIETSKAENKDNIDEQKRALFKKWLAIYPEAKYSDVIEALEKADENTLANDIQKELKADTEP